MSKKDYREIPYNFTSADDRLIINQLFGPSVWEDLEELRSQRVTGRSARLVMRFMGDLFILHRNPFLYQELIDSPKRRRSFFKTAETDLAIIESTAQKVSVTSERSTKVVNLVDLCRQQLTLLRENISGTPKRREDIKKKLAPIIGKENICFDPFSLISHATDATDWRLFLPIAVLRPETEAQVAPLMDAIADLHLHIIPRGGGTGLTGGSVPVRGDCVIINTEKLNRIFPIHEQDLTQADGTVQTTPVLCLESGVITQDAMAYADKANLVFATDPTSAWASTIGGNIAENAGGKTAVLWGTAIDNILSYKIAMPGAGLLQVRREGHPLRKILPDDSVVFNITDEHDTLLQRIELQGDEIRKKGLWKDITNKALKGLPGVQKEGTDGIITSAEFVLYRAYEKKTTFCLEFFGADMDEASRVIVEISEEFTNQGEEALMALEHFDDEYIKAIDYKVKAARSTTPKAVLLIDMVAHTDDQIKHGKERLTRLLESYVNTEVFIAKDNDEAVRFWRDRKRLGAIAARTNAFKLNEDIVLPLPALAEFARFVDAYNMDEDIHNKERIIHEILAYLEIAGPIEDPDWLEAKKPKADELCMQAISNLQAGGRDAIRIDTYINGLKVELLELFRGYKRVSSNIEQIYKDVRKRRIIIATHMHAGDGNVHVNIPVFSNDRYMMQRAEKTAEDIMEKAVALGGVVSGEHGIGITKMKFLDEQRVNELTAYRKKIDPQGLMNPGKLEDSNIIEKVFTPSFNLLELEARILQYGSLETLSSKISRCIRCGKCKADCCVFHPGTNLFFHPRNKNLVIGALIEALLYDMQRSRFPRFNQLKYLEEVADHCTMCRKCLPPCPVDIDTAEVSILERQILQDLGYKHSPVQTVLSLQYLKNRNKTFNAVFRKSVVEWGAAVQRKLSPMAQKLPQETISHVKSLQLLQSPMARASKGTLRDILPATSNSETLLIQPKESVNTTVFYFPGCGSERLYADISMAALYILLKAQVRVVLPPPFLCCGFPAKVNAKQAMHGEISLRDTIILSQIRDMLGYINFDAFVISCGTCKESLHEIGVEDIFDCPIKDVSRYAVEKNTTLFSKDNASEYLYHTPCHDSMEGQGVSIIRQLGHTVEAVPYCCSEAGTMALSRPDISGAMLIKKGDAISEARKHMQASTILTNCPSCISGLSRNSHLNIHPEHLAEKLARDLGGNAWQNELPSLMYKTEIVTF
ncbi:DUF3683 domain-containing protein [Desulfogranum japonicum]|uniref:DUF3683 domain-containing protein n=1 Tax=Desulfogranum japonicum TaxID=231447 RepID=UPI00040508B2|nr:DUF3683 domain-containing protein [Desulfogranum japonicum]